jgi:prepilin-type N-terminal cleavage/methylation domain-containing protein
MRSQRGFVLAEALVVAVIVAILAAVAIPVYTGYVTSQKQSVVTNLAQTASMAAGIYVRRTGASPATAADLKLFYDATKYTITVDGGARTITVTDLSDPTNIHNSASF